MKKLIIILSVGIAKKSDYIPRRDTDFDDFQDVFMLVLVAQAAAWGVPPGVVTNLQMQQTSWVNIWNVAKNKKNRTATQV